MSFQPSARREHLANSPSGDGAHPAALRVTQPGCRKCRRHFITVAGSAAAPEPVDPYAPRADSIHLCPSQRPLARWRPVCRGRQWWKWSRTPFRRLRLVVECILTTVQTVDGPHLTSDLRCGGDLAEGGERSGRRGEKRPGREAAGRREKRPGGERSGQGRGEKWPGRG